ncbi:MAG: hypothetical protein QOI08_1683 [Actinomycetota bacterium]|nr:hypothetical protein [Actinomycetota bacterium]
MQFAMVAYATDVYTDPEDRSRAGKFQHGL